MRDKENLLFALLFYSVGFALVTYYSHIFVAVGVLSLLQGLSYERRHKRSKRSKRGL